MILNRRIRPRLERKNRLKYNQDVLRLVFDFYGLIYINSFCGEGGYYINYANKARKITESAERITNKLYLNIREALEASVVSELRYVQGEVCTIPEDMNDEEWEACDRNIDFIEDLYMHGNSSHILKEMQNHFHLAQWCFDKLAWDEGYGGPLWGTATSYLLQHPVSFLQKTMWIDNVLDLQHNSGFILDKTDFYVLSLTLNEEEKEQFKNEQLKHYFDPTYLDYRAAADLPALCKMGSGLLKKIYMANVNFLPKK